MAIPELVLSLFCLLFGVGGKEFLLSEEDILLLGESKLHQNFFQDMI